jgi:superfamily II DNA/RNA helicase
LTAACRCLTIASGSKGRALSTCVKKTNKCSLLIATSIDHNAKGKALIKALGVAFAQAAQLGAAQKAIIFTESRRTQSYLLRALADSPFSEGIVLFNGSNTDDRSKEIYAAWLERHQGTDQVTGSRSADMRSALVDYFREQGRIMIATEAGAEGINLQFCSLVVNYDLPWNPQRIEQRIGRCHRYGQKHDVVVVNFLNRKNDADRRVFELVGKSGELALSSFTVQALDQAEDYLIFAAVTDDGQTVDDEAARRLLSLPGAVTKDGITASSSALETQTLQRQQEIQRNISERNARFFEVEVDKLEGWADDLKLGLEREIKELDRQIKEARRAATTALTLEDKLAGQKQIKTIESLRNQKRRSLFEAQDQVDKQREELIAQIEGKLAQTTKIEQLLAIRWRLA